MTNDTICAIATPPGRGGVGIVRLSGPKSLEIARKITKTSLTPRNAHYCDFHNSANDVIDQGLVIYFKSPHSFTGEEVVEFQGHGGPVILDTILSEVISLGARLANPGEFSERAFLNDKIDLTQAEAIADLIDASSQQAAKLAISSLRGGLSNKVEKVVDELIHLRMYVESAIDFPEEEIDFLNDGKIATDLDKIISNIDNIIQTAQQGIILKEGMKVVIAGRPNAGKSSLLNCLAEKDIAIVTDIAGTTRDVLREHIHIDGMPLHIIDTAGLRESPDQVEKIGIEKAWQEIEQADRILLMVDSTQTDQIDVIQHWPEFTENSQISPKLTIIYNKIDKSNFKLSNQCADIHALTLSVKNKIGIDELKTHLKEAMGYKGTTEGGFSARRRHLLALENAKSAMEKGRLQLLDHAAGELLAEDLRIAQDALNEITGSFTADDLLGKIFSSFCIGK